MDIETTAGAAPESQASSAPQTIDRATDGASVSPAAAPSTSSVTPPPSLGDIARQAVDKLADGTGLVPGAPKPPAQGSGLTAPGQVPTTPGDLLQRYGVAPEIAAALPPEAQSALADRLTSIDHGNHTWYQQVEQWGQQIRQQAEGAIGQAQQLQARVERIAGDPRFQQALQAAINPAAQQQPPPQFETETEKRLWTELQQLRQSFGAHQQQFSGKMQDMEAWRGGQQQAHDQQLFRQSASDIQAAHAAVDKDFPELAGTPDQRRTWHTKAADLLELQAVRGEPPDVSRALREAAMLLHYPQAVSTGATRALSAARKAAKSSTLREQGGRPGVVPRGSEKLRDIAETKAAELAHA